MKLMLARVNLNAEAETDQNNTESPAYKYAFD
jgi:hypothetical protein